MINPKTNEYLKLKEFILSSQFQWSYLPYNVTKQSDKTYSQQYDSEGTPYNNFPIYYNVILERKETRRGVRPNPLLSKFLRVYEQILEHNNIPIKNPYRICVNASHPTPNNTKPSPPHIDHGYPHRNMIIYLTPTYNGHTIVQGEPHPKEEDDILVFDGVQHHLYPPTQNRRVVIVCTFPK